MSRRALHMVVALMVMAGWLSIGVPARADTTADVFLTAVNALRLVHGLAALQTDPTLTSVAQSWSQEMASTQHLEENPNLKADVGAGFVNLGENVAYGGTLTIIYNGLTGSPPHLANMLSNYTVTGVGVASSGTYLWVTEVFADRSGAIPSTTATTAAPAPPATTAPPTTARTVYVPPATVATLPLTTTSTSTSTTSTSTSTTATTVAVSTAAGIIGSTGAAGVASGDPATTNQQALAGEPASSRRQPGGGGVGAIWIVAMSLVGLAVVTGIGVSVSRLLRSN